jgi:microcystin-dependent protein
MADPTTSNILLAIPTRGSDSGQWDTPVNGDFTALDGILGGNVSIALAAATTLLLTVPATGSVSPTAGPNQSQNALIKFSGTLTGNAVIQVTLPRIYTFDTTALTVATSYVQVAPASGTGTAVGLPPGEVTRVSYDGTNVKLVGLGRVGSYLDLAVATTQPWMSACTGGLPYIPCDGATYTASVYPALGNMLGSTFGGNGITTFGLPDFRNRFALPIDTSGQGRVTTGGSGVDGTTLGANGGSQLLQQHNHTVTEPNAGAGHAHGITPFPTFAAGGSWVSAAGNNSGSGTSTNNATTGISINNAGTGSSQNMPPVVVFGCRFIKT